VALANPGRIIGIFIRDVTTPANQGFFDSSMGPLSGDRRKIGKKNSRSRSDDSQNSATVDIQDLPGSRPPLPKRIVTEVKPQQSSGPAMGTLIDFSEEPEEMVHEPHKRVIPRSMSDFDHIDRPTIRTVISDDGLSQETRSRAPPIRPSKPLALRSSQTDSSKPKPSKYSSSSPPPPPPKPRRLASQTDSISSPDAHPLSQTQNTSDLPSNEGYLSSARQKVSSAYNALPAASSYIPGRSHSPSAKADAPPPPPRRNAKVSTAPKKVISWRNEKSTDTSEDDGYSSESLNNAGTNQPVNKKVELWKRRYAKAKSVLEKEGVELRTWRVGGDVCLDAVQLVERNLRELGVEGYGSKGKLGEGGGEIKVKDIKREGR
jgi:hypothetical protein